MNLRGDAWVLGDEAMCVMMETVNGHAWSSRLDGAAGAALADAQLQALYQAAVESIMSNDVQVLPIGVQLKDAGTLSPGEMDCLGSNDLQHFIQVKGRSNDRGDAVNGGQFVDFAAQLFVCLLIKSPIFDVDGDDTGNDLQEVSLRASKFTRVDRLDADDANETHGVAKEDDRYSHEPM